MNITFLIGNGFDLACGLNTSYKDFLAYYLKLENRSDNIAFFKEIIRRDLTTWADAEMAFGEYTSRYKNDEVTAFRECFDDFIHQLGVYLGLEEDRLSIDQFTPHIFDAFLAGLSFFDYTLSEESKEIFTYGYDALQTEERTFNVLTFNYTTLFDALFRHIKSDNRGGFPLSLLNDKKCLDFFDKVIHVHSDRNNPPLIFGVDNEEQIKNKELLSLERFTRSIIKPDGNKHIRNKTLNLCIKTIEQSNIICVYGMSLGLTDSIWWTRILDWLKRDRFNQLVLYSYAPNCRKDSVGSYADTMDDCREYLYNRLLMTESDCTLLHDQVHIQLNTDLFGAATEIRPYLDSQAEYIPF